MLKPLEQAFAELAAAPSWEEAANVVERNPRLLDANAQEQLAQAAQAGPTDDIALAMVDDLLERLRECRERGSIDPLRASTTLPWQTVTPRFYRTFDHAQKQFDLFRREGQPLQLDASLRSWRSIRDDLDFLSTAVTFQLVVADGLEACYLTRHHVFDDSDALERGIELGRKALERTSSGARLRGRRLTNLAGALSARFQLRGERSDVDKAVDCAREAVGLTPESSPLWPGRVNSLAVALSMQREAGGTIEDPEEAIGLLRHAVSRTAPDVRELTQLLHNLGNALISRYRETKDLSEFDEAIAAYGRAVNGAPPGSPDRAMFLGAVGRAYLLRYSELGADGDLDVAIEQLRAAVEQAPPGYGGIADLATGLGYALRDRFERSQDDADLADAVKAFRSVVLATPLDAPAAAQYIANHMAALEQISERLAQSLEGLPQEERAEIESRRAFVELELHSVTGDDRHLTQAIDGFRRAADATDSADLRHREHGINLALALRNRALRRGSATDLDEAMDLIESLAEEAPADASDRWRLNANVGVLLIDRFRVRGSAADVERAIELLDAVRETAPTDGGERAEVTATLVAALREHALVTGSGASLDRAIATGREALESPVTTSPDLAHETAEALLRRSNPPVDDVEEAIRICWAAIGDGPADSPEYAGCFNALGGALKTRFGRTADNDDLAQAVNAYRRALTLSPGDPTYLSNVGAALRARFVATGDGEDLDAAIEHLRAAVDRTDRASSSLPGHLSNLAAGLLTRFGETDDGADLDAAVDALQEAVAAVPADSLEWFGCSFNLGEALLRRYEHAKAEADYEEGVCVLEAASAGMPPFGVGPLLSHALADALRTRLPPDAGAADVEAVRARYRHACETGLDERLEAALASASAWGDWALEREAWTEATEAYAYGLTAIERGIRAQLGRSGVETWLRQGQRVPASAAFALARAGRLEEAVETIERGRARLLSEALELDRRDLERLPELGHADLYRRYRSAAARSSDGGRGDDGALASLAVQQESRASVVAGRQALAAIVEEIRAVPGYADFLRAHGFEQVAEASGEAPLAYLVTTAAGGLVLIVSREAGGDTLITSCWLECLTMSALGEHVVDYVDAYVRARKMPDDPSTWQAWSDVLYATTKWLGEVVVGPLAEALGASLKATPADNAAPRDVVLVASGLLGLLPLGAAWVEADGESGRPAYALDALRIRYAPNARALLVARDLSRQAGADRLALVVEPKPVSADALPHARMEGEAIAAVWPPGSATTLPEEAATRASVAAAIEKHTVLHFAGHAFADMLEPVRSGLLLASDEVLSVADFRDRRLVLRLAILSACETGVPGLELPDEVVGLPTALVQAGAGGVIASLWPVADDSTAILMGAFHRHWRRDQATPAEALRRAQIELRDGSYEHLYFWAPFTYTGASPDEPPVDAGEVRA
jgi:tetratricopeptide (TPR) repeat protein